MKSYDKDIVAWANEQAQLLRAGRFDLLDIERIADEIEDVGKSEQNELASRMALLLSHLLKWAYQPQRRGNSWLRTIRDQRRLIQRRLDKTPSLRPMLSDPDWQDEMWVDAVRFAQQETGLDAFPENCPWSWQDEVLAEGWLPQ
ncbi:DUF29 domain-containing protein [Azohydromonas aeria]|uniref:DUF29 domain-containing protein n=1 Tax=Azohydromonas aeria TaxID=2590212 RepID=UPI0012FB9DDE|nr:DUF29 domain-containing protein [Azohydromonas aeria]